MTPTETAAFLRRFNAWRRGDEAIDQPDPREIGLAIDAAIEMIERLEPIKVAAQNLVETKGGYNTAIAYHRLVHALEAKP